jgi:hypothetical protein
MKRIAIAAIACVAWVMNACSGPPSAASKLAAFRNQTAPSPVSSEDFAAVRLGVSGVVTGDGTPLAAAAVSFSGGPGAVRTDQSGRYETTFAVDSTTVVTIYATVASDQFALQPCAAWARWSPGDAQSIVIDVPLRSAGGLLPQTPTANGGRRSISGRVSLPTATGLQPVPGAWIAWERDAFEYKAWTRADNEGRFSLCGLPSDQSVEIYAQTQPPSKPHCCQYGATSVPPSGDSSIEVLLDKF